MSIEPEEIDPLCNDCGEFEVSCTCIRDLWARLDKKLDEIFARA